MPDRRSLIGTGLLAGLGAAAGVEAAPQQPSEKSLFDTAKSLQELAAQFVQFRKEMVAWRDQENPGAGIVTSIRTNQRTFLRATGKFPDYMDIGIRAWEAIHDWHSRFNFQWNVTRQPDGRYATSFMLTTFILRPEQSEEYIGLPYDKG